MKRLGVPLTFDSKEEEREEEINKLGGLKLNEWVYNTMRSNNEEEEEEDDDEDDEEED